MWPARLVVAHVVKAVEQAGQRALARTGGPDHRHRLAGRDVKADAMQDLARRLVGEAHVLELDRRRTVEHQVLRTRLVGDFALLLQQHEHLVQVGQALLDLAVEHPQEPQRDVELDHEGVDHHQIAQRHAAVGHTLRRAPEHEHQRDRDHQLLPGVQQRQRGLALDAGAAQLLQRFVVTPRLESLVVEVLDRFVVEQRVDGARLAGGLQLVHLAPELGAPFGHRHGEGHIEHQRHQRDPHITHVELGAQQREHHDHFDQRREDAVERIRDERLHAARAALDVARHAAGLALQVEAQAERVQVPEHLQRDAARGALGGLANTSSRSSVNTVVDRRSSRRPRSGPAAPPAAPRRCRV
ncbi:hypothetical protein Y695_03186 [Hydrogenophaga sp. T4]|nr:hypothetical protein Y695_03186 [Hydrogenophaga sp. T4]